MPDEIPVAVIAGVVHSWSKLSISFRPAPGTLRKHILLMKVNRLRGTLSMRLL